MAKENKSKPIAPVKEADKEVLAKVKAKNAKAEVKALPHGSIKVSH
tara:strand:- start:8057 stop:8194 length:138 start_codon:yes stop_codon:yes gene_type:complete